jgi:HAMP domain-containing protein
MFERFTERARQTLVLAHSEARALEHDFIGTEHILLGLLVEKEGLAALVLKGLGVTLESVRVDVAALVSPRTEPAAETLPFTPRAKKVLELALREALSLGHNFIGTEHILLGIARENEGVAARLLERRYGADADKIRGAIIEQLGRGGPLPAASPRSAGSEDVAIADAHEPVVFADAEAAERPPAFRPPSDSTNVAGGRAARRPRLERPASESEDPRARQLEAAIEWTQRQLEAAIAGREFASAGRLGARQRRLQELQHELAGQLEGGDEQASAPAPLAILELDYEIEALRHERQTAIEARAFERAAKLRDDERRLARLKDEIVELADKVTAMRHEMDAAVEALEFERAAELRDRIESLLERERRLSEDWWQDGDWEHMSSAAPAEEETAAAAVAVVADHDAEPPETAFKDPPEIALERIVATVQSLS